MTWWQRLLGWFRPGPTPKPAPNPGGVKFTSQVMPIEPFDAKKLLGMHNAERAKHALPPLLPGPNLNVAAMARASHAAAVNLTGPHLHDGLKIVDPADVKEGENAAMGQADAVSVMEGWMESEGHRDNILGDFNRVGFGRAITPKLITYWFAIFAR